MVIWWLCISSSGETRKLAFLSQIFPTRSRSIVTQNNRNLNQGLLHLWSKFGDPSLERVLSYRVDKQVIDTHWHTYTPIHTQTQAMTIPEGQNWPREKNSAFDELMAWRWTGNKPLPTPMLTKMPEAIVVLWPHIWPHILVNIDWRIGLMPHQRQAISSTNPDLNMSMESSLTHWYLNEKKNILQTTFQMHLYAWKLVTFN